MRIIRTANYQEMSQAAANIMTNKIRSAGKLTLGLATGSTPSGVYEQLISDHFKNGTSYINVQTVNLDEYIDFAIDDPNSYHSFMKKNLFDQIDINAENTAIPNGMADDLDRECERYEELIRSRGGIDLQLLGIGQNGHIGFNEPGTPFSSRTHIVNLAESTRQANSRFFPSLENVPKRAITMGIATILDSREILLLASGEAKAEAISRLISGDCDESFPASALKLHENVTIIADEEALKYI